MHGRHAGVHSLACSRPLRFAAPLRKKQAVQRLWEVRHSPQAMQLRLETLPSSRATGAGWKGATSCWIGEVRVQALEVYLACGISHVRRSHHSTVTAALFGQTREGGSCMSDPKAWMEGDPSPLNGVNLEEPTEHNPTCLYVSLHGLPETAALRWSSLWSLWQWPPSWRCLLLPLSATLSSRAR